MKRIKVLGLFIALLMSLPTSAQDDVVFEDAYEAVKNMALGWNLGNTLDANSGSTTNMWIELWSGATVAAYETAWGQPLTKQSLMHMFKESGFNAIRIPVTWYPHIGNVVVTKQYIDGEAKGVWDKSTWTGYDVNSSWMSRVKEVVDYVINEGMYCILNVHHDTGDATTAWLTATPASYNTNRERYEELWTQIATEFRDYDEHLLFEGYNEMLDSMGSWNYASSKNYNALYAKRSYQAINSYAQSFVDAVRATGGNNSQRNLIVSTYGACCGMGTWSDYLQDPLKYMKLPADSVSNHIIFEVHSYPNVSDLDVAKTNTATMIARLKSHLVKKGAPVIFGEWGTSDSDDYTSNVIAFSRYFVEVAKAAGMATFRWMCLSDGKDRSVPKWTEPEIKEAMVKGYYGEDGYVSSVEKTVTESSSSLHDDIYNLQGLPVHDMSRPGIYIKDGKKFIR